MRERIFAIGAAALLVAVAIVVRSRLAGDDGGGTGDGRRDAPVVACAPDLAALCDELAASGRIAANPPVLDLTGAAAPPEAVEAWITWDPAPGIANVDAPGTWDAPAAIGSAPLAVLATAAGLPAACPTPATWACLAEAWSAGNVAVGTGSGGTADGLARLAPLAAALVPDGGDFRSIPDRKLQAIVASPPGGQDGVVRQIDTMLTTRGAYAAVLGPEPALEAARARPAGGSLRLVTPAPRTTITVVISARRTSDVDTHRIADQAQVGRSLAGLGLERGGTPSPDDHAGDLYQVRQKAGAP
jgi:hypothetical protein